MSFDWFERNRKGWREHDAGSVPVRAQRRRMRATMGVGSRPEKQTAEVRMSIAECEQTRTEKVKNHTFSSV